jgi:hypothetical protein
LTKFLVALKEATVDENLLILEGKDVTRASYGLGCAIEADTLSHDY